MGVHSSRTALTGQNTRPRLAALGAIVEPSAQSIHSPPSALPACAIQMESVLSALQRCL
jgi:hypothetical protein